MSDTYSVIYSPKAKDDLREIYSYIVYDLQTAEEQVNRIRKEIRSLDFMPSRYAICDPNYLRRQGCRGHHSGRT